MSTLLQILKEKPLKTCSILLRIKIVMLTQSPIQNWHLRFKLKSILQHIDLPKNIKILFFQAILLG